MINQQGEQLWKEGQVKIPTVLQMEAVECGAASLAMIFAYFGLFVPLEKLREACGVSRDGSKASNILKAARSYGFNAKGYRLEPEGLHYLPLPMILFWNLYHFVVFEGYRDGGYYINDPAAGRRKVTPEEFSESFSGVVLSFEPTESFNTGGKPFSIFEALSKRIAGLEKGLVYIVLASLLLVIPGLVIPSFLRIYIDYVLVKGMTNWLQPLFIGMLVAAVLQAGLTWLQKHYLLRTSTKMALSSSARFFNHVFGLPVRFFSMRQAGEVSGRVHLNDEIANLVAGDLTSNALNVLLIIFYALLMLRYDVLLTLIAVFLAAANILTLRYVSSKMNVQSQKLLRDHGKLVGTTFYGVRTIESIKASGSENDFFSRWSGLFANMANGQQRIQVSSVFLGALPPFLQGLGNIAILSVGALRIMEGGFTLGMLLAFQSLFFSFLAPLNEMVSLSLNLQYAKNSMMRLDDVMNNEAEIAVEEDDGLCGYHKFQGFIELKDVTFGFNRCDPPLIENLSLKLSPGSRVALVGGSGSGKSTISKIVSGLYAPWSGEVLFDGVPREEIHRKQLSASLSMVDQEISLFQGSIGENISMWDETIPREEIIRAARDAAIHDVIVSRPGGYQGVLTEGGNNFSGGQRQRMELARAFATNPSILILDEATSALDPLTEQTINDNLRARGCTCLIVAHRLSTIRDCDEIIVLEHGKVKERGTHESLLAANGIYAGLIKTG